MSYFSVIQYFPNPVSGERMNVGVLAFDEDQVQVRFLSNWDRARYFGRGEDIALLKEFACRMEEASQAGLLFPGDVPSSTPRHKRLLGVTDHWINSIQLTEPRGSLDSVGILLEDMVQTFLLDGLMP